MQTGTIGLYTILSYLLIKKEKVRKYKNQLVHESEPDELS
jgi:hypothetical protein